LKNAIKQVHLESVADKRELSELSDGQLQMAMIAKALGSGYCHSFLDEPTAHLDLNNRVEIMNLASTCLSHERDKTILVATHEVGSCLTNSRQNLVGNAGYEK
jgi:iron complex transport system ATP-binding protein